MRYDAVKKEIDWQVKELCSYGRWGRYRAKPEQITRWCREYLKTKKVKK